jgi:hypothetical protein
MQHFSGIFAKLSAENQREFLNILMAVVHSHRHNKEDTRSNISSKQADQIAAED